MCKLIGVVLCGGESRRMGRDKGLIDCDGVSWAERMGLKLASFGLQVVYSIRAEQETAYSAIPGAILVVDSVELGGPINGLLSVHRRFPADDLLVLACDMQDMDNGTIGGLIAEYRRGGAEFYVYYEGALAQPFCAIYTAGGLSRVSGEIGEERRMRTIVEMGVVQRLEVKRQEAFGNYNSM